MASVFKRGYFTAAIICSCSFEIVVVPYSLIAGFEDKATATYNTTTKSDSIWETYL